ncbi:peptidoglycan DD-metalloendopeptidase family protein [Flavobacteriaceae bacterium]|nr:peptidoglycan DD-metalloendopeptidase family protein [Flavobacteriaceae bacterium]|tara:strand:- start:2498 stop:3718 length:1221 start_codon:yes stop_codon:yes gene_type:complete
MIFLNRFKFFSVYFFVLLFINLGFSQKNKKEQLELKRTQIEKEIKFINELLFSNKKKKKAVYSDIENLSFKIQRKEELVKLTNQQINLLDGEIKQNIQKEKALESDLLEVKKAYQDMILKSYKTKSGKTRLMFLLSSESFFQAYKRVQYIKQFTLFRKNQAMKISSLVSEIVEVNKELKSQKINKEDLLLNNRLVQKSLENEKKESNTIADDLRKKEKKYINQIAQKQKTSLEIDKEIERLIREAIAKSNKEKNKSTNFSLTPEALELSKNFTLNKGKLPWPVIRGVVIQKFGTQPHPVVKTAKIKSNGIIIATVDKEKVRTVFDGTILSVLQFKGGNPTILVQHGKYITAYKNLSKVYVKKGDKVFSGQNIGEVFTNNSNGKSTIQFSVFQNTTPVNPLLWIIKM